MKKRIALVNQRYGAEVNGGSEYYTRQLAEHLVSFYDVEVLTTKALDYVTWKNYYQQDKEQIQGVSVKRFTVSSSRNVSAMRNFERLQRYIPLLSEYWGNCWVDAQGPYVPDLVQYIKEHKDDYAAIIFVTYLYYPTVKGLPQAADRSILLPTAHDEPYIYYKVYNSLFLSAKCLAYLTPEEKAFVESRFPVKDKENCICGTGVDVPEKTDSAAYRKKYGLEQPYLIYVGRIDENKGCIEMFHIFRKYKEMHPNDPLKLVLMGKSAIQIPKESDIVYQGFVSEEDKFNGVSGAEALWLPSKYESLSIAVLEAMALGTPVIVNGNCEVLKGHCERSGAGIYYNEEKDALEELEKLRCNTDRRQMSERGKRYIAENYRWEITVKKLSQLIENMEIQERELQ